MRGLRRRVWRRGWKGVEEGVEERVEGCGGGWTGVAPQQNDSPANTHPDAARVTVGEHDLAAHNTGVAGLNHFRDGVAPDMRPHFRICRRHMHNIQRGVLPETIARQHQMRPSSARATAPLSSRLVLAHSPNQTRIKTEIANIHHHQLSLAAHSVQLHRPGRRLSPHPRRDTR